MNEPPLGRLLLVEDDPLQRKELSLFLRGAGWGVDDAASGAEAFDCAMRRAYEAIVVDFWLPDVSGAQAIRTLRTLAYRSTIVVSTADPNHLERERECREAGADAFWRKGAHGVEALLRHLRRRRGIGA